MNHFSRTDERKVKNSTGLASLLDKKCPFCHRSRRSPPCEQSDHYWSAAILVIDDATDLFSPDEDGKEDPYISSACQDPTAFQAPILPAHQTRRHPYDGPRPKYSGYCIPQECKCPCHNNAPLTKKERNPDGTPN
jgi:hypothetical protein